MFCLLPLATLHFLMAFKTFFTVPDVYFNSFYYWFWTHTHTQCNKHLQKRKSEAKRNEEKSSSSNNNSTRAHNSGSRSTLLLATAWRKPILWKYLKNNGNKTREHTHGVHTIKIQTVTMPFVFALYFHFKTKTKRKNPTHTHTSLSEHIKLNEILLNLHTKTLRDVKCWLRPLNACVSFSTYLYLHINLNTRILF